MKIQEELAEIERKISDLANAHSQLEEKTKLKHSDSLKQVYILIYVANNPRWRLPMLYILVN